MQVASLGMGGLLASERAMMADAKAQPVNTSRALADPRQALKITSLEIIPVHSLRSIFVKMHTDAGIIGLGEGTVEGKIETVVAAISQLEPYLKGKDPRARPSLAGHVPPRLLSRRHHSHQRAGGGGRRHVGHQGQGAGRAGL